MPTHHLTQALLRELLFFEPEGDAVFRWRRPASNRIRVGAKAGNVAANGRLYISLRVNGTEERHLGHHLAWLWLYGEWPTKNIAPRNGDYLDFHPDNLIPQSHSETASKGRHREHPGSSGVKGVYRDKARGKWAAYIDRDYRRMSLGRFDSFEDAVAARKAAEAQNPPSAERLPDEVAVAHVQRALDRRIWERVIAEYGRTGWKTIRQFHEDVGFPPTDRSRVAPLDIKRQIGPENWQWTERPLSSREQNIVEWRRKDREKAPERYRSYGLRRDFGIDQEYYLELLAMQDGVCAICKEPERDMHKGKLKALAVDHDEKTKLIRGLLCQACNTGLGKFGDDPDRLQAAIVYLQVNRSTLALSVPSRRKTKPSAKS